MNSSFNVNGKSNQTHFQPFGIGATIVIGGVALIVSQVMIRTASRYLTPQQKFAFSAVSVIGSIVVANIFKFIYDVRSRPTKQNPPPQNPSPPRPSSPPPVSSPTSDVPPPAQSVPSPLTSHLPAGVDPISNTPIVVPSDQGVTIEEVLDDVELRTREAFQPNTRMTNAQPMPPTLSRLAPLPTRRASPPTRHAFFPPIRREEVRNEMELNARKHHKPNTEHPVPQSVQKQVTFNLLPDAKQQMNDDLQRRKLTKENNVTQSVLSQNTSSPVPPVNAATENDELKMRKEVKEKTNEEIELLARTTGNSAYLQFKK